ncbi:uncharacterized protein LOC113147008 [Cyclospora cayetanensis]|uniref:Uncharacterized protein LOC113147008 n=1 Tax=Cyclospora cayetanensis TaxID=88456 RepID=A0A6P6RVH6_9EIME|nr:uncharacterized protein LOC113147008 [Cyclospora cayetanensis]
MQIFEQLGETKKWKVSLSPLSMESREGDETAYRLVIHDDLSPLPSRESSNSSGTCKRKTAEKPTNRYVPSNARNSTLVMIGNMFEQQMQRRVSRRTASAAETLAGGDDAALLSARNALPTLEVDSFTLEASQNLPIPTQFSWLFKFRDGNHCLLLNTLYSAFSDKANNATLFLTSSKEDFHRLAAILNQGGFSISCPGLKKGLHQEWNSIQQALLRKCDGEQSESCEFALLQLHFRELDIELPESGYGLH